jgi:hypothetical protein
VNGGSSVPHAVAKGGEANQGLRSRGILNPAPWARGGLISVSRGGLDSDQRLEILVIDSHYFGDAAAIFLIGQRLGAHPDPDDFQRQD